ncbi:hypothetical protein MC885_015464 [Smutsia gigantea]|nr:hypothetical protein MC885_015464 [Smutsia gigantea]
MAAEALTCRAGSSSAKLTSFWSGRQTARPLYPWHTADISNPASAVALEFGPSIQPARADECSSWGLQAASIQDSAMRAVLRLSLGMKLGQAPGVPDHAPPESPGSLSWAPEDKLRHRADCNLSSGGAKLQAEPRRVGDCRHPHTGS